MNSKEMLSVRNISILAIVVGVVLLCYIWMGLFYQVQSERQKELDNAVKDTANYARTFEEHTLRTIKGLDEIAQLLKYQAEKEGLKIDLQSLLKSGRFVGQPLVQLSIADETGDIIASNLEPFVAVSIKDREHFSVHKDVDSRKLYISKPLLGRVSGKWSIQLTRRINKVDGSFGGVVVVSIDPYYFAEFYKQVNLGKNSSIAMVGRDYIVRVRQTNDEVAIGQDLRNSVGMEKIPVSNAGYFLTSSPVDGIDRVYSYRALNEYPLIVVAGVSEAQVFHDLNKRVTGYYWGCGILSIGIGFFVFLLLFGVTQREQQGEELICANKNLTSANEILYIDNEKLRAVQKNVKNTTDKLRDSNKVLEKEIRRIRRLHNNLAQMNQTLAKVQSKEELYSKACRLLVEGSGLKVAWIGEYDLAKNVVNPVAWEEEPRDYVIPIPVYADFHPVGWVVTEGASYICNDIFADPNTLLWRESAKKAEIRASAFFVFYFGGVAFGVLNVYADEPDVFTENEVAMLEELTVAISLGLEILHVRNFPSAEPC